METPLHLPQQQETVLLSLPGLLQTLLKCGSSCEFLRVCAHVSLHVCVCSVLVSVHAGLCLCCANVLCVKVCV